jgi:hypothetical protein
MDPGPGKPPEIEAAMAHSARIYDYILSATGRPDPRLPPVYDLSL